MIRPSDPGWIAPGSPQHLEAMSPSKAAAVVGLSPWASPLSTWLTMRGDIPPEAERAEFARGHALEHAVATMWRDQHPGWRVSTGERQWHARLDGVPWVVTADRIVSRGRARALLEVKSCGNSEAWASWGEEPPSHVLAQVLVQMAVSGLTARPAHISVLGPWLQDRHYTVPWDADRAGWIVNECNAFWLSLHSGERPELDDSVATYEALRQLHPDIDGTSVDCDPGLAAELRESRAARVAAERRERAARSAALDTMGLAAELVCDGQVVARRHAAGKSIALKIRGER